MDNEEVETAYRLVVEGEERVKLIKEMIRRRVGVSEVEFFFNKQRQHCRWETLKHKRSEKQILASMKLKLSDAVTDLKTCKFKKINIKKEFLKVKNKAKARRELRELEKKSRILRGDLKEKNEQKVKHLVRKFKPDCNKLPSIISKYSRATIFKSVRDDCEAEKEEKPVLQKPLIYGDINIDEDETAALLLDPKFAVFNSLSEEEFEVEIESCLTKMKWNKMSRSGNCEDEKEREDMELEEAESREVYDSVDKTFNMRKQRVTDLKHNAYVIFPKPQPLEYEALLEIRRQKLAEVFKKYVTENCDEKGRQLSNLTRQQARGLKKLKKRVTEGELIVAGTDKSGKLCVMPKEMYMEAGEVHTSKDRVVSEKLVHETQKKLNGHVSMWIKCLQMGENWDHRDRLRETQINHSDLVAPMYLQVKDHKKYSGSGPPPTRPVCGAVNGMDVHLSNILSPIIEAVADEQKDKKEVISTDDSLSRIDTFNRNQISAMQCQDLFVPEEGQVEGEKYVFNDVLDEILGDDRPTGEKDSQEYSTDEEEFAEEEDLDDVYNDKERQTQELVVCGADVKSLFPSLRTKEAAALCYEAILETEIDFEGIDYQEIAIFIALNLIDFKRGGNRDKQNLTGERRFFS